MPSASTRKRRYVTSKMKRVPDHLRFGAPKKLNVTLEPNFPHTRFKTPKRTAVDLIKLAKENLPDLAECLVVEE